MEGGVIIHAGEDGDNGHRYAGQEHDVIRRIRAKVNATFIVRYLNSTSSTGGQDDATRMKIR